MAAAAPGGKPPPPPPPAFLPQERLAGDAPAQATAATRTCRGKCHRTLPLSEFVNKRDTNKLTIRCLRCRGETSAGKARSSRAVELMAIISGSLSKSLASKRKAGEADLSSPEKGKRRHAPTMSARKPPSLQLAAQPPPLNPLRPESLALRLAGLPPAQYGVARPVGYHAG